MVRLRVTSVLGSLLILALAVGSLVVLGRDLVGDVPAMVVLVLVLVVFFGLAAYGERFASGGTPYW